MSPRASSFISGEAWTCCRDFAKDSADAAFLDADKSNYPSYLEECLRIVRPAG